MNLGSFRSIGELTFKVAALAEQRRKDSRRIAALEAAVLELLTRLEVADQRHIERTQRVRKAA